MRFSLALVAAASLVFAHPGEHHEPEPEHLLAARQAHHAASKRGLNACANKPSYRSLQERAIERRADTADLHRRKLKSKRANPTGVGHNLTTSRPDIDPGSDAHTVFGDDSVCILDPEGEVGPFYVKGELVREDLREDQAGVPIVIEGQFIDVETCEPLTNLWWDIWNCNSTGVYGGVVSNGNGNVDDESNINATFLRGIQETNHDGVVTFQSIFPGHYSGRTTHHHIVAWINATEGKNQTLTSGTAAHIGQLFWDQDLVYEVESTYPYNTNDIEITTNAEDRVVGDETTDSDSDPFFNYVYLGDSVEDGLFGWVTIGINTSAVYDPTYSFEFTSGGGVAVGDGIGPGGSASGTPSGTPPAGFPTSS